MRKGILLLGTIFLLICSPLAAQQQWHISPHNTLYVVGQGDSFTVEICLSDTGQNIAALGLTFHFPNLLIEFDGFDFSNTLLESWIIKDVTQISPGELKLAGFTTIGPIAGPAEGILVKLNFVVHAEKGEGLFYIDHFTGDLQNATSNSATFKVKSSCNLNVNYPSGGEIEQDCILNITWTTQDPDTIPGNVKIDYVCDGIVYSIIDSTSDDGEFQWIIHDCITYDDSAKIKITDLGDQDCFNESAEFELSCLPKLGDVNWVGNITPADALCAFSIYMNGGTPPPGECDTTCALYAADANCDGSVTPQDALIIFEAYINNIDPLECPAKTTLVLFKKTAGLKLNLAQVKSISAEKITMSINVDNPYGLDAFGFDMGYSDELLSFVKVTPSNLTKNWHALDGQENKAGVITIGGFNPEAIASTKPGALAIVTFKVKKQLKIQENFWLFNLTDDLTEAKVTPGGLSTIKK